MSDRKQVVIELRVAMLEEVPADWNAEQINFWLNDSSLCLSTQIKKLQEEEERAEEGCCFTCHRASGLYLRDATPDDLEDLTPPKP